MNVTCVWEHNGNDTLLYANNVIGAFTRGTSKEEAIAKMEAEVRLFLQWSGKEVPLDIFVSVVQEKDSTLMIRDADSDVLFDTERGPMTASEYAELKALALKSADDFERLYRQIPDKHKSALTARPTFYEKTPVTAWEMYKHTRGVNRYYFGEIGVEIDEEGGIADCRRRGFVTLETTEDYLENRVFCGSYDEEWSLRKVLRRFLWHDRIHAKAMWRMARKTFPNTEFENLFLFDS